jgi:uncharacterized protein YdiU (UPF0061 family)
MIDAPSAAVGSSTANGLAEVAPHPTPFDGLRWRNRFSTLPPAFFTRLAPTSLPDPYRVAVSRRSSALLGLEPAALESPAAIAVLAGNRVPTDAEPLAAVYSGHQFGVWAGQLGDGRAHLLGGVETADGTIELQWKGAGRTPYSRGGDGRAVLRSSIREFLCSEAMHGLGIPTTRALAITGSDQPVIRETVETAAVLMRMAPSFVRFGSFEHWFSRNQYDELRILADDVIDRFYPEAREAKNPYQALLAAVTGRTARLIAQWQAVGFCHGVMNTDNMSILGLTLDYGPFGFLDAFDANHICNHTDEQGRYAYARQPSVARWNCYCLAEALMPLIDDVDGAEEALATFQPTFGEAMDSAIHAKLGLADRRDDDNQLAGDLFALLQDGSVDYTLFFRRLADLHDDRTALPGRAARDLFVDRERFDRWAVDYRARAMQEAREGVARRLAMNAVNPKYVLRNHLAEEAIVKARAGDFSEIDRLCRLLERPFDEQPESERYADLPPDWATKLEVSCSS